MTSSSSYQVIDRSMERARDRHGGHVTGRWEGDGEGEWHVIAVMARDGFLGWL